MKAIVILPGQEPTIKEVSADMVGVVQGHPQAWALPGLHMDLVTDGDAWASDLPQNGTLHTGASICHVAGPAVICRKNAANEYTDVRLCDLGLIQACWTPYCPRLEEKERREDD